MKFRCIFVTGARHLEVFRKKAEETGKSLPISISIGVDPAIEIAACLNHQQPHLVLMN